MGAKSKKIIWVDLERPKSVFTIRNAAMKDLNNNEAIRYYSANTKIQIVQKGGYKGKFYYRTQSAKDRGLDWAFEASAFGLPEIDVASLEPETFSPEIRCVENKHAVNKQPSRRARREGGILSKMLAGLSHPWYNKND